MTDSETLTRLIVHPIHYDEDKGTVHPLAFNEATTLDLSVFREELATDGELQLAIDQVRATGQNRPNPQDRFIMLVMQASAGAVRSAVFEGTSKRMCYVYDTAVPDKPAHASVFTPPTARKGSEQRQVRRELLRLFSQKSIRPEDYRALSY